MKELVMKKKIVVMVCLSTIFMQGMEHCWEIMVHGTKIELLKGNNGDVFMYTKDTDFIVVGQYEQQALGGHQTWRNPVGVCSISKEISFLSNKYNQFANIIAL